MSARIPFFRKLGYGIGDFGFGLYFLTASQFLLYFYTDVMGLSPAVAGLIIAVALVWDAVSDPVMGVIANRTRSRWGRYRPYLLAAPVPLALSWALMFLPTGLSGTALALFAAATHVLFRTIYTVASMPYLALSAAMTEDSNERSGLASFRLMFQAFAGVLAAFATLPLAERLGGGPQGFFHVALIYGAIATLLLWVVFAVGRETATGDAIKVRPTLAAMLAMLRANRAFWMVCGAFLMGAVGNVFFNKSLPYYMKQGLGREDLIGPSLGILAAAITFSIPLWAYLSRRTSKRRTFLVGTAIVLAAYAGLWFAPLQPRFWLPLIGVLGAGSGAIFLSSWAMMPDTVEYGEWKSGVRAEGAVFGFVSLAQKASLGVAAGLLGLLLTRIGYDPAAAVGGETMERLKAVMILLPALFTLLAATSMVLYPIDQKTHVRLVNILARRRLRTA